MPPRQTGTGTAGRSTGASPDQLGGARRHVAATSHAEPFGFRPRRATGLPPNFSASASVTSSSREPRRASAKVMRTTAPLPSGISAPDMSEIRIVFRAISAPFSSDRVESSFLRDGIVAAFRLVGETRKTQGTFSATFASAHGGLESRLGYEGCPLGDLDAVASVRFRAVEGPVGVA